MKKNYIVLILALFVVGCSGYTGQDRLKNFLVHPESWLRDPHFAEYKQKLDALESEYLRKEITYAEYVNKKNKLDAMYDREVQERTSIISSSE